MSPRKASCSCGTCPTCRQRERVQAWRLANVERNRELTAAARRRAALAAARRGADAANADDGRRYSWDEWKRRYGHPGGGAS